MKYFVKVNGHEHEVVLSERLGELLVEIDGEGMDLVYEEVDALGQVLAIVGDSGFGVSIEGDSRRAGVTIAGHFYDVEIEDERERAALAAASAAGGITAFLLRVQPNRMRARPPRDRSPPPGRVPAVSPDLSNMRTRKSHPRW